jgi:hypothetical protein
MLFVIATIRRVYFMLAAATTRQLDGKACSMKSMKCYGRSRRCRKSLRRPAQRKRGSGEALLEMLILSALGSFKVF